MSIKGRLIWIVPLVAVMGSFGTEVSSWSFPSPLVDLYQSWFLYPTSPSPSEESPKETTESPATPVGKTTPGELPGTSTPFVASRRERWRRSGEGVAEDQDEGTCATDLKERILQQATRTMVVINEFKDEYTRDKYNMTWDKTSAHFADVASDPTYLVACSGEQDCLPVLPSLPSTSPLPPTDDEEAKAILTELSGYCRQYCEALNQIFLDESLFEERFKEHLDAAQGNMESLANLLVKGVDLCDGSPDNELVKDMVDLIYRMEGEDMRKRRGFGTIRQCLLGLQYIIDIFSAATY
ncbi:uncharacterized protein LOC125044433 [Penaeus chinensis]|uniref:uncharacterized protein LOC125044433 n=1 Tax=Penaeus chinensis TaxID=139456 RepID=UPI001FB5EBB1|nr:uncharacterized protein LOC125044433 [Penaeus chinensis]